MTRDSRARSQINPCADLDLPVHGRTNATLYHYPGIFRQGYNFQITYDGFPKIERDRKVRGDSD